MNEMDSKTFKEKTFNEYYRATVNLRTSKMIVLIFQYD